MEGNFIFLCIIAFIAAFIDSVAGGGGLISVPAFLMFGLPPHLALGTNKLAATTSSLTASIKFIFSGKINFSLIKYIIPFTFIGAVVGVKTVLLIDQSFLNGIVMILILLVGVYTLFSKNIGIKSTFKKPTSTKMIIGFIFGFVLGFYDGFFGPGTGSFLIFGFIGIFGFDFIEANCNAKILNFTSNIASLITFALSKSIDYKVGLICALFMVFGSLLGAKMALKQGVKVIKPVFVTMSLAVALKMLFKL